MKNDNKKNKKSPLKRLLTIIPLIILILISSIYAYTDHLFSKVNTKKISENNSDLGIKTDEQENKAKNDIVNIALFGLDVRQKNDPRHSDCIMILTIDEKHKDIKLSSIMRDSYVDVKNHGKTKITHAYGYGGPQGAIWALNHNFDLNIKKYASVNFINLEKIIDALGGVKINVLPNEVKYINHFMIETSQLQHKSVPKLTHSGLLTLNGRQAVSYARIRSTAGGDYERTLRQRAVLNAIIDKLKKENISQYPKLISEFLPLVETNLTSNEIISLGKDVLLSNITTVKQARFPLDKNSHGEMIDKHWYLITDINKTKENIHDFIFNDIEPKGNHNEERNQK